MPIPNRIIQTGKSRQLPLLGQACAANLKLLNPDFEYQFFDDPQVVEFMARQELRYREAFDNFRYPIQRFDFFRYLAVYHYGGFYFDLDVVMARPLESLLDNECVFSFEELGLNRFLWEKYGLTFEIGNYAFGAAPGHPFLKAVIENCVRAQHDDAWLQPMMDCVPRIFHSDFHILNTTGPGMLSRTLAENPDLAHRVSILMPPDPTDRRHWHNFGTYGVHLMEHSWRPDPNPVKKWLFALWMRSTRNSLVAEGNPEALRERAGLSYISA